MSTETIIFLLIAIPLAVYGVAKLIFAAYFQTKADYLRRFFRNGIQTEDQKPE